MFKVTVSPSYLYKVNRDAFEIERSYNIILTQSLSAVCVTFIPLLWFIGIFDIVSAISNNVEKDD